MRDLNDVLLDKMLRVGSKKRDNLYRQTQWGPLYSSTNQRKEGSQRTQIGHQRKLRTRTFYIGVVDPQIIPFITISLLAMADENMNFTSHVLG